MPVHVCTLARARVFWQMGNWTASSLQAPGAAVSCPVGQASCHFPFRVTAEAARAAAAAAMGTAVMTTVDGYTSAPLRGAGASAVLLRLPLDAACSSAPYRLVRSGGDGSGGALASAPCFAASLRAPRRLAFLSGIAVPCVASASPSCASSPSAAATAVGSTGTCGSAAAADTDDVAAAVGSGDSGGDFVLVEVVVLARPDWRLREVTQLGEEVLRKLLPLGSSVDLRMLLPLPPLCPDAAASHGSLGGSSGLGSSGDVRCCDGDAICTARRLSDGLLRLAALFEGHFGAPRPLPGAPLAYEEHETDREGLAAWLADAGLALEDDPASLSAAFPPEPSYSEMAAAAAI